MARMSKKPEPSRVHVVKLPHSAYLHLQQLVELVNAKGWEAIGGVDVAVPGGRLSQGAVLAVALARLVDDVKFTR
jgi:hypothetical protein